MSWQATGYVKPLRVSSTGKEITRGEKLVLLLLADYIHPDTGVAWPSMETIADEAMYERRQVIRILESLESKNFITIERSEGKSTNRYRICGVVTKCHNKKTSNSDISSDILPSNSDISASNSDIAMSHKPINNHNAIEEPEINSSLNDFSLTTESNGKTKKHKRVLEIVLPEWLPAEEWNGWLEMRQKMHKAATPLAQKYAIEELDALRLSGQNVREVIRRAITKNWLSFYAIPNQHTNGNGSHNGHQSHTNGSGTTGHLLDHLPDADEIQRRRIADDKRLEERRNARGM